MTSVWLDTDAYGKRVYGSAEAIRRLSAHPHHVGRPAHVTEHDDTLSHVSAPFRRKVHAARSGGAEWVHAVGRIAGTDERLTHRLLIFGADGKPVLKIDHSERVGSRG